MRHYELVTILSPMLNQDEASAAWGDIKTYIANRAGEITAEQVWGTRRLAYPIRKGNYNFLEGSYYLTSFTAENPFNRELENYLRLDERVLRSLVLRCEGPLPDKPPPGPLTAPSRYIPPGRARRGDGGGPIPEAPGGFGDRGDRPVPRARRAECRRARPRRPLPLPHPHPRRQLPRSRPRSAHAGQRIRPAGAATTRSRRTAGSRSAGCAAGGANSAGAGTRRTPGRRPTGIAAITRRRSLGGNSREQNNHHRQPGARPRNAVLPIRQPHDQL